MAVEEIEEIRRFGRGTFTVKDFSLAGTDGCPKIEWMTFTVRLEGGY